MVDGEPTTTMHTVGVVQCKEELLARRLQGCAASILTSVHKHVKQCPLAVQLSFKEWETLTSK